MNHQDTNCTKYNEKINDEKEHEFNLAFTFLGTLGALVVKMGFEV
jgi:hypothetical protein